MDKNGTSRHGACDRCRGQKLRCVGSAQPIANPTSRVLRNAIPCDRCRRAKVDCYSVRPAPRRTHTTTTPLNPTPPSSERSSSSYTSRGSSVFSQSRSVAARVSAPRVQQDGLLFPGGDQPNDRLSAVQPPIAPDWITYSHEDGMGGDDDLEGRTPSLIGESNSHLYQDPVPVNIHEQNHHPMLDLINPTGPEDWNPDPINMDTYPGALIQLPPSPPPSKVRKLTTLDGENDSRHGPPSRRLDLSPSHTTTTTTTTTPTRSSIHELAKLHETLLREKSHREYTLTQRPDEHESTLNQRSIGQTLHHCQRFVSILKRIRYSRPQDDSGIAVDEARARGQVSGHNRNRHSISTTTATPTPALTLPTLFSILFCYTSILASYEDIFLSIIEAITRPTPTIPPTLSGLRIDGFELDGHSTLQLECLLNVSHTLLEKVEGLLFGSAAAQGGGGDGRSGGGIIRDKLAPGLMDMLFEEGDRDKNDSGDGYGGEKSQVRVKRLIQEIQATLNEIDF